MEELFDLIIKLEEKDFYLQSIEKDKFGYSLKLYNIKNRYLIFVSSYLCIYCNDIEDDIKEFVRDLKKILTNIRKGEK